MNGNHAESTNWVIVLQVSGLLRLLLTRAINSRCKSSTYLGGRFRRLCSSRTAVSLWVRPCTLRRSPFSIRQSAYLKHQEPPILTTEPFCSRFRVFISCSCLSALSLGELVPPGERARYVVFCLTSLKLLYRLFCPIPLGIRLRP